MLGMRSRIALRVRAQPRKEYRMGEYRTRILLAVDGSDQAFEAVRYVSQLFAPDRLEVVLFHVMSKIPESFWDIEKNPAFRHKLAPVAAWAMQQERLIREFMERSQQLLVERGVPRRAVSVRILERQAGIARDILREAQNNYDAVVAGRWGMSKLMDLVWGSVANKLVGRLVYAPICVVGGAPQVGKILLAVDGSDEAMRTVDFAATMLQGTEWEITLFHVLRGFEWLSIGHEEAFVPTEQVVDLGDLEADLENAEKAIQTVFEKAMGRFVEVGLNRDRVTTKIVTGAASRAKAIVEEAKNGGYGTIVVGRRGLSRVEEFFIGRVSNKVMQLAKEMAVWVVG